MSPFRFPCGNGFFGGLNLVVLLIRAVKFFKRAMPYFVVAVPVMRSAANRTINNIVVIEELGVTSNACDALCFKTHKPYLFNP